MPVNIKREKKLENSHSSSCPASMRNECFKRATKQGSMTNAVA